MNRQRHFRPWGPCWIWRDRLVRSETIMDVPEPVSRRAHSASRLVGVLAAYPWIGLGRAEQLTAPCPGNNLLPQAGANGAAQGGAQKNPHSFPAQLAPGRPAGPQPFLAQGTVESPLIIAPGSLIGLL